ncbi:MAG: oligosaccharide flippase family protein [Pseudomonadota bacterium]
MSTEDNRTPGADKTQGVAGAGGAALAAKVVAQASQLLLFIVAARFLVPADFGVFALVAASSALLFLIAAAGWREFIMSWGGSANAVNQALTLALTSGYAISLLGLTAAAIMVLHYESPILALLTITFSACVLMAPMTSALGGLLVRLERVPMLSAVLIVSEIAGLGMGVYGLVSGWGILALGAAKLITQLIALLGSLAIARWPLRITLRGGFGPEIKELSQQILINRVINFLSNNASIFIVGFYLGVTNTGLYRAAERVISSIAELVFDPLRLLAWMVFRRAADRAPNPKMIKDEVAQEASIFLPLTIVFASPVFVGLSVVSEEVVTLLLGEVWLPAAPVVSILAMSALLLTPNIATEPLLTLNGKVRALAPIAVINAIITIIVLLAFTRFGLIAAAFARLAASFCVMAGAIWLQTRHAGAPWLGTMKRAAPLYTALIALVSSVYGARFLLADYDVSLVGTMAVEVLIGAVVYFGVIMLIRPSYLRSALWL